MVIFHVFLAIKRRAGEGELSKSVRMMLLIVLNILICSDFLALNGKKSYAFFKIEKSLKRTSEIYNKIFKSFKIRFKLVV